MAISVECVKQLQALTSDLAELIVKMRPITKAEWDVFDGAVEAHKKLRKLDTDALLQLELPLEV